MWISAHDGSAEKLPTPEQVEQWQRRMAPPENELPAGVGITVLLASSDDVAVGLTQVEAFSTGFRFTLAVRARRLPPEAVRGDLFMHVNSHLPTGLEIPLANRLLVGIEYSDGRRASTLSDEWAQGSGTAMDTDRLVLVPQGGGGAELSVDQAVWVAPLPPPGDVTIVLAWPGFGIEETRTTLDGDALLAAAARSRVLWPTQAAVEPAQPPAPPRPASGWFAGPFD